MPFIFVSSCVSCRSFITRFFCASFDQSEKCFQVLSRYILSHPTVWKFFQALTDPIECRFLCCVHWFHSSIRFFSTIFITPMLSHVKAIPTTKLSSNPLMIITSLNGGSILPLSPLVIYVCLLHQCFCPVSHAIFRNLQRFPRRY